MKIHPAAQGSVDWAIARSGIVTASEMDALISPTGEVRRGQMVKTYLHQKLSEWWLGGPLAQLNVWNFEQGHIIEEEVGPWYELEYGQKVIPVGLITNDAGTLGCSPDGLLSGLEECGLEIKAPAIHTHIGYLLDGKLPSVYAHQVQGSMYVTGFTQWKFISYRRRLPSLVVNVARDDKFQAALHEAIESFLELFEGGKKRLCELNGGPPKRPKTITPQPQFVSEMPS